MPNVLARVSTMFSAQLSSYTTAPDALNLLLVESLEYESSQMLDFHSMSKHVEKLAGDNDRVSRGGERAKRALGGGGVLLER